MLLYINIPKIYKNAIEKQKTLLLRATVESFAGQIASLVVKHNSQVHIQDLPNGCLKLM